VKITFNTYRPISHSNFNGFVENPDEEKLEKLFKNGRFNHFNYDDDIDDSNFKAFDEWRYKLNYNHEGINIPLNTRVEIVENFIKGTTTPDGKYIIKPQPFHRGILKETLIKNGGIVTDDFYKQYCDNLKTHVMRNAYPDGNLNQPKWITIISPGLEPYYKDEKLKFKAAFEDKTAAVRLLAKDILGSDSDSASTCIRPYHATHLYLENGKAKVLVMTEEKRLRAVRYADNDLKGLSGWSDLGGRIPAGNKLKSEYNEIAKNYIKDIGFSTLAFDRSVR